MSELKTSGQRFQRRFLQLAAECLQLDLTGVNQAGLARHGKCGCQLAELAATKELLHAPGGEVATWHDPGGRDGSQDQEQFRNVW